MYEEDGLFILVALTEEQTQTLMSFNGKSCFSLGLSAYYYMLLRIFWPCHICKINGQLIDFNTTHCLAEPVKKPYYHNMVCSSTFRTAINSYRFKLIIFGVVCTDEFDTQVCLCNRLKDLRGHAVERIPVQNPLKPLLQEHVVCALPSSLTRHMLFEICSAVGYFTLRGN